MTRKISHLAMYLFIAALRAVFLALPPALAVKLGALLGRLAYFADRQGRKTALDNIGRAFPQMPAAAVQKLCKAAYANQGKNFAEFVCMPKYDAARLAKTVTFEGEENLAKAAARGRGTIIITAHFGNWELLGAAIAGRGYRLSVIAREFYVRRINDLITKNRAGAGLNVIMRATEYSARDIIKAIRSNHMIGILIDQDTDVAGDFVEFFGREAHTPIGPAAIALKTGCSVVYAFMIRESDGRHRAVIEGPLDLARGGDEKKDVVENTRAFTARIEYFVRRHPEQWIWYHKRWKTKNPAR